MEKLFVVQSKKFGRIDSRLGYDVGMSWGIGVLDRVRTGNPGRRSSLAKSKYVLL
jgi:hypothetical protein